MNIKLSLFSSGEMRAFATFLQTLADNRDMRLADNRDAQNDPDGSYVEDTAPAVAEAEAKPEAAAPTEPATRKRRTKAEIAAEAKQMAIQTGDERIDPETAAQDAEDEAAEAALGQAVEEVKNVSAAVTKEAEAATLTHDDLRAAMAKYVKAFGMAAAQEDSGAIFKPILGDHPLGEAWKASSVPQDKLLAVINAWAVAADGANRAGA